MLWKRERGAPPRIFAHRGLTTRAFENTLTAYRDAMEAGVFGIEMDISMTRDGKLVCFHDRDLLRISGVKESLRSTRFSDLRAIPLEGRERVPTVDEALDVIDPDVPLIFDIKTAHSLDMAMVEPLRRLMRRRELTTAPHITITSFNYLALNRLADAIPGVRNAFIFAPDSIHARVGMLKRFSQRYSGVHPQRTLVSMQSVKRWHAMNLTVSTWVVNEADEARRVAEAGVDLIVSDDPLAI